MSKKLFKQNSIPSWSIYGGFLKYEFSYSSAIFFDGYETKQYTVATFSAEIKLC